MLDFTKGFLTALVALAVIRIGVEALFASGGM